MSRVPTDTTLADTDTWEKIADFTGDSEGKPLAVRVTHLANVAPEARILVDPLHGNFTDAAPPTDQDGAPLASGESKEWVDRTGSGEGVINSVWAKSAGLATLNVDPSAA